MLIQANEKLALLYNTLTPILNLGWHAYLRTCLLLCWIKRAMRNDLASLLRSRR